jgi:REP-associated tyrosine transposase
MSRAYKFRDQTLPYFVTFAVVGWVDLFTRIEYSYILLESLRHCQKHKGLILYAWVIMPSHVHMIIGTNDQPMQGIMRDFKSFTSRKIKETMMILRRESRREWLIGLFRNAGRDNGNNMDWQLWQQNNQPTELWDNYMIDCKLRYLHNNPVKAKIVYKPEDFVWSSAGDYAGMKGMIDVKLLD